MSGCNQQTEKGRRRDNPLHKDSSFPPVKALFLINPVKSARITSPPNPLVNGNVGLRRARFDKVLTAERQGSGAYPFTLQNSVKGYRVNKFLHRLMQPAHRQHFLTDPESAFEEAKLTEEERDLIRRRDWPGLIHYGVIFFMLEKLGAVIGVSNFVAGDAKQMAWDKGGSSRK
jgi:hypothetical protein